MGFLASLDTNASALTAQRLRMDIISQNIANASTTRTENGTPYRRKTVVFEEKASIPFSDYLSQSSKNLISSSGGVRVAGIIEDTSPFKKVYDPGNPEANAEGYVEMPNVNIVTEMVDMISATRAYEANITAINTTKSLAMKTLEIK